MLVEFKTFNCTNRVLEKFCKSLNPTESLPITTRFLYYSKQKSNLTVGEHFKVREVMKSNSRYEFEYFALRNFNNINDQIKGFYEINKIDDISSRLRFFVAAIIEGNR